MLEADRTDFNRGSGQHQRRQQPRLRIEQRTVTVVDRVNDDKGTWSIEQDWPLALPRSAPLGSQQHPAMVMANKQVTMRHGVEAALEHPGLIGQFADPPYLHWVFRIEPGVNVREQAIADGQPRLERRHEVQHGTGVLLANAFGGLTTQPDVVVAPD